MKNTASHTAQGSQAGLFYSIYINPDQDDNPNDLALRSQEEPR